MTSPSRPPASHDSASEPAPGPPGPEPDADASRVAKKAPPADRKFPCRKCGGLLNYDPTASALVCPYCGYVEQIEPQSQQIEEHDLEEYLKHQAGQETVLAGRSTEVRCSSCGAVVLLEDHVAMDRCPYCAAVLENQPVAAQAMIAPESLLPFRVARREAIQAFDHWVSSLWFAPSALLQLANLGQLSGVYVPFWTYDAMTYTHYTGSRGIDYTTSETYTTTNAQGQTETQTRLVTHTAWYPASGRVDNFFDDLLVYASKSLPSDKVDAIEPWDLNSLQAFDPSFLAGFKVERYTVDLTEGFQIARQRMDVAIRQLCCQDIGGNHQVLDSVQTQYVGVTFKHLLLPVWLAAYNYQGQPFRILINARTGEVNGTRPYSWVKISLFVMTIAAAAATAALFISMHH